MENSDEPSVHRFGSTLQVVWQQAVSNSMDALHTRILAAGGAPVSANKTLLRWEDVSHTPAVTSLGGGRLIAFSGLQNDDSSNPYSGDYGYALTSRNGTSWTLADDTLGSGDVGDEDATDVSGVPVVVYAGPASNEIGYHSNFGQLPPPAGTQDPTTGPATGCCAYDPGVGYDPRSGQTWAAWYSNSSQASSNGIDVQRIYPSAGTQTHAPYSASKVDGQISSVGVEQRVQVVARNGGGLYTAYGVGYPNQSKIALWKLGSRTPLLLATHDQIQHIGVTTAPGGRLWVFWSDLNSGLLRAVRTNTAGTRFGAVRTVHPPAHTGAVWSTAGDAGNGRLDLLINASVGQNEQIFATQVLPGLSAHLSPTRLKSARGGKLIVTVSDAGAAVRNASVRYGHKAEKTNSRGQVRFTIVRGTKKGTKNITFSAKGYARGTLHLRIT